MLKEETIKIYGNNLNPEIWNKDFTIKDDVRKKLLDIAKNFYKDLNLGFSYSDILLLGSNANYNWNEYSDLDLHILINTDKLKMEEKYIRPFLDGLKNQWNDSHDIKIHGFSVEIYIQAETDKNAAKGVFSLLKNKWIQFPKKEKISIDKELIKKKYNDISNQINNLQKTKNLKSGKKLWDKLKNLRKNGLLTKKEEFSTGNILFKLLRTTGKLQKLYDLNNQLYDKKESLKEFLK